MQLAEGHSYTQSELDRIRGLGIALGSLVGARALGPLGPMGSATPAMGVESNTARSAVANTGAARVAVPGQADFIGPLRPLNQLDEVAGFVSENGFLPKNFIDKDIAKSMGWNPKAGNLDQVAPKMSIGGDIYQNRSGALPKEAGRIWYEGDLNYQGGYRGNDRILYSNDGLIYTTSDHYKTFTKVK